MTQKTSVRLPFSEGPKSPFPYRHPRSGEFACPWWNAQSALFLIQAATRPPRRPVYSRSTQVSAVSRTLVCPSRFRGFVCFLLHKTKRCKSSSVGPAPESSPSRHAPCLGRCFPPSPGLSAVEGDPDVELPVSHALCIQGQVTVQQQHHGLSGRPRTLILTSTVGHGFEVSPDSSAPPQHGPPSSIRIDQVFSSPTPGHPSQSRCGPPRRPRAACARPAVEPPSV